MSSGFLLNSECAMVDAQTLLHKHRLDFQIWDDNFLH